MAHGLVETTERTQTGIYWYYSTNHNWKPVITGSYILLENLDGRLEKK